MDQLYNVPSLQTQLREAQHRLTRLRVIGAPAKALRKQEQRVHHLTIQLGEAHAYRDHLRTHVATLQRKHRAWAPFLPDLRTAQGLLEAVERRAKEPVAQQLHQACAGLYGLVAELTGVEDDLGRSRAALIACGGWSS